MLYNVFKKLLGVYIIITFMSYFTIVKLIEKKKKDIKQWRNEKALSSPTSSNRPSQIDGSDRTSIVYNQALPSDETLSAVAPPPHLTRPPPPPFLFLLPRSAPLHHPALPPASKLSFLAATPPASPLLASTFSALLRVLLLAHAFQARRDAARPQLEVAGTSRPPSPRASPPCSGHEQRGGEVDGATRHWSRLRIYVQEPSTSPSNPSNFLISSIRQFESFLRQPFWGLYASSLMMLPMTSP
jgi:hypothetical protein